MLVKMEQKRWTDHERNVGKLTNEQGHQYHANNESRKANWIGQSLLRNYLLKHLIEENMEGRSDEKMKKKTSAATG